MKNALIILILLCSNFLAAQKSKKNILLERDSFLIKLPNVYLDKDSVVLNTKEEYYKFFSRYHPDSLPTIDFSKEYLSGYFFCPWCSSHCDHARGICHRNACRRQWIWRRVKKE